MENRTEEILLAVIKEHIKTAQPVGSEVLQAKYKFGISSATIRSELAELEQAGYIAQPHTSAGRIPTSKAYEHWVDNLKPRKIPTKELEELDRKFMDISEDTFKLVAKELAQLSNAAIIWAFHRRSFYYTGVSNLLTQPEFVGSNLIYDISAVVDRIEDILDSNFDRYNTGLEVMIGELNPFSKFCSSIVLKYQLRGQYGIIGILAPLRQDYERNVALLKIIEGKLK
jgi:heat-inducible transcriptional repressor